MDLSFCVILIISLCQYLHAKPFSMFPNNPFHHSSSQANANAFNNFFTNDMSGSSASNAFAQSFRTNNFGASASHSQNQNLLFDRFGAFNGNANLAGSQSYTFGDRKINVAYSNGFSIGPDGVPQISNGHSITFDK